MNGMNVDIKALERAINGLTGAFIWSRSPQGHDAWQSVLEALEEIQRNAKCKYQHG